MLCWSILNLPLKEPTALKEDGNGSDEKYPGTVDFQNELKVSITCYDTELRI